MPLYEYTCRGCNQSCELLVRTDEVPVCPHCGKPTLDKQMSVMASPAMGNTMGNPMNGLPTLPPGGGCGRPQCGTGGCARGGL